MSTQIGMPSRMIEPYRAEMSEAPVIPFGLIILGELMAIIMVVVLGAST